MIIKNKKNCQIIEYNENYYLKGINFFKKYKNRKEALVDYKNIKNINLVKNKDCLGRISIDLYKEDIKLILKSIEVYKFYLSQNLFFTTDKEKLDNICYDLDFMYEMIFATYNTNFENCIDKTVG